MQKELKNRYLWGLMGLILLLVGCQEATIQTNPNQLTVFTSIYPLEHFTKKIGGKHVQVHNLVPAGTEPHDFELSAQKMAELTKADLVVYNGAELDTWLDKAKKANRSSQTKWLETTKNIHLLANQGEEHGHKEETGHVEEEHAGEFDPHVWLNPLLAKKQAHQIKESLIQVDSKHKTEYEKNYQQLAKQLDQLDQEIKAMTVKAKKKEFVVSHAAFGYLAEQYGLSQIAVSGLSPADEPSAKDLQEIIHTMNEHQLKHIFFETLVSSKVAQMIQREVKAQSLTLNPLEGLTAEEKEQNADYFSIMRKNKENLAKALEG